jgi:uncharacterized cupin superfamily protein
MLVSLKTKGISLISALSLVILFTTLQSSSCSKSDDVATINTGITGTWRVSLYWDKKDETSKFSGYNFSFNSGGQLTASNGASNLSGTWSESSTKFTINFGTDPTFSSLNKDWLKEEKTATSIKLKDDNPAKDEKIQFAKN